MNKFKLFSLFICFIVSNGCYAQKINEEYLIGRWQRETPQVADAYYYSYVFYKNKEMEFKNNEIEGLNRIVSIKGSFVLKKDTLLFLEKSIVERVGGIPQLSETMGGSGWEIDGGKEVITKLSNPRKFILTITTCPSKGDAKCIEIDSRKYYKVE